MSYHGKVSPGGAPDVRELPELTITKFSVSEMDNNVYLLHCRATDEQVLVDAADDAPRILQVVGDGGLVLVRPGLPFGVTVPQLFLARRDPCELTMYLFSNRRKSLIVIMSSRCMTYIRRG